MNRPSEADLLATYNTLRNLQNGVDPYNSQEISLISRKRDQLEAVIWLVNDLIYNRWERGEDPHAEPERIPAGDE